MGIVKERSKNGFLVNVGIDAFMPESHADLRPVRDPDALVGQTFKVKVIKFDRKTENAVVSRKLFLQDERDKKKTQGLQPDSRKARSSRASSGP